MLNRIRLLFSQFFQNSQTINNEPLNKVSLIVIILVDIFILINVFTGLDHISRWHLSPYQVYPCYSEWNTYKKQTTQDKDYEIIRNSLPYNTNTQPNFRQRYQQEEIGHLGKVSEICLNYGQAKDKANNAENRQTLIAINQTKDNINKLAQANLNIRNQYDSTLLEKIAGQSPGNSINQVAAEKAKQELDNNNRKISTFKQQMVSLQSQLLTKPEIIDFLSFLKDETKFTEVDKGYQKASFWYPSLQLIFQSIFLLPLIIIALLAYKFSQKKGYGVVALISWHLLVIFLIPLILKIFQFLQIGAIAEFIFNLINKIFGSLLFLISYVYIFLIPLVGFGLIKLLQTFVFNTKSQAAKRVQKSQCINCAKTIKTRDAHCPHCGYYQYVECPNCHNLTYKKLPYCYHCGTDQNPSHS
ncbi:hypothetical protein [Anabaena lutea]|uniref:Zinc ribbon domain-containing protein n=1 Tax=Anabaena lutea FACHB-196 TaxID=2692881 RepID=A0ABR8FG47_9NOST|nr:hypothetical protein [Anabaena lutea]MBD2568983.1 hypothetical protein [Anabaena lutea FACHB-196]